MENKSLANRFDLAIRHLITLGLINGKSVSKGIAMTMNRNEGNISSARRGDSRYLNKKFIKDFCATYKNIISEEWILEGVGEMLTNQPEEINKGFISDETLTKLSKDELVALVKQLMALHEEQTAMYQMMIRQNDQMIRNGQDRFNNITNIISNHV